MLITEIGMFVWERERERERRKRDLIIYCIVWLWKKWPFESYNCCVIPLHGDTWQVDQTVGGTDKISSENSD